MASHAAQLFEQGPQPGRQAAAHPALQRLAYVNLIEGLEPDIGLIVIVQDDGG